MKWFSFKIKETKVVKYKNGDYAEFIAYYLFENDMIIEHSLTDCRKEFMLLDTIEPIFEDLQKAKSKVADLYQEIDKNKSKVAYLRSTGKNYIGKEWWNVEQCSIYLHDETSPTGVYQLCGCSMKMAEMITGKSTISPTEKVS